MSYFTRTGRPSSPSGGMMRAHSCASSFKARSWHQDCLARAVAGHRLAAMLTWCSQARPDTTTPSVTIRWFTEVFSLVERDTAPLPNIGRHRPQ